MRGRRHERMGAEEWATGLFLLLFRQLELVLDQIADLSLQK